MTSSAASTASSGQPCNRPNDEDYVMCQQKKQRSVWELEDDDVDMVHTEPKNTVQHHLMVFEGKVQSCDDGFDTTSQSASAVTVVPVKENDGKGKMHLSVGKLECMKCKVILHRRSEFLLLPEKEDWCQALWGWCQECSGLKPKEFKKQQNKQWLRRQREATGITRMRGMEFGQLMEVMAEKFPGAAKRSLLKAARTRVLAVGRAAALAAFGVQPKTKERYEDACKLYFDALRAVAEEAVEQAEDDDASHSHVSASKSEAVVKPASATKSDIRKNMTAFLSSEADFLTMVTTSISVSYACKGQDCRFYGLNDQWFQKQGGYQFRCPNCSKLYRPWKVNENTDFNYAKVICVVNPLTGEKMIFPAKWPDSAADTWLQTMMTATAHDVAESRRQAMTAEQSLMALDKMLRDIGVPGDGRFVHFDVKETVISALKTTTDFKDESVWSRHRESGFWGNILPRDQVAPIFDEWPTFIALFANLMQTSTEDEIMSMNLDGF